MGSITFLTHSASQRLGTMVAKLMARLRLSANFPLPSSKTRIARLRCVSAFEQKRSTPVLTQSRPRRDIGIRGLTMQRLRDSFHCRPSLAWHHCQGVREYFGLSDLSSN